MSMSNSPSMPAPARPDAPGSITSQLQQNRQADYLQGLNPEQAEAAAHLEGPLLILAGAGTGKTRVLTTRIAHIIATGAARGNQILAVTFTNKAAREMKERVGKYVGPAVEGMQWLGTFHSIGARILRYHAELVGLKSDFTILDTDDQVRLLKQLIQAENIDEKRWPAKQLGILIDSWKNRGLTPDRVGASDSAMFADGRAPELYAAYQARLKVLNAADFGDLLLEGIRLFQENPDLLADYHKRFKYMLVDEYQDTNVAQYLWLRLLAQGNKNVCVVGDDDQSIYGWRGAEVDNILRFEKDFPGAKVVKLERNYRSTSNILRAASHIIAHNEDRLGKTLQTDTGEEGDKLVLTSVWDSQEEARLIGEQIENFQHKGDLLNSMAILVRTSAQMREFEERFVTLGLNYRVIGGPRFYERREIRDAVAYLRTTFQQADSLAFERIINTPRRGLAEATMKILHMVSRAQSIPLMEAARILVQTEELRPAPRKSLTALLAQIDDWAERSANLPAAQITEIILDESGYTQMWQNDKSADAHGRLENLKELVRALEDFDTIGGFLEHISLVMDTDKNDAVDAVSIMTLHGAKGLEFDTVFLPGWEEGLFPSQRSLDESGRVGLEEERRLAYVGLTRARKRILLSLAQNRRTHGLWQTALPSRFLDELPPEVVDVTDTGSSYGGYNYGGQQQRAASRFDTSDPFESNTYDTPGWQRAQRQAADRGKAGFPTIEGNLVAKSVAHSTKFKLGDTALHLKFGTGEVIAVDGNKLTIEFDKAGRKKVLDSFLQKPS